jgi:hypothetical protein
MTRQSEVIHRRLRSSLDSPPTVRRILFTMRAPSVTRINLAILKILLSERNERGIYLTVDRPETHVISILEKHNVAAPSEVSAVPEPRPRRIVIAQGIFSPAIFIDDMFTRLHDSRAGAALDAEIRSMDFLMVDNLSSLAAYNGPKGIDACFEHLAMFLDRYRSIRFLAAAGRDSLDALGPPASTFFNTEVSIPDEWLAE